MRLLASLVFGLLAPIGFAQSLDEGKAGDFVDSLGEVNRYGQAIDTQLSGELLAQSFMPEPGEDFTPYTGSMAYIEEQHPEIHAELSRIVGDFGFGSLDEWAMVGDQVMSAYLALELDHEQFNEITPEMLDQMPPQMRPQMERVLAMVQAVRDTPQENIDLVRPLKGRIDQQMGSLDTLP